jgi:flavodoxin
MSKLAIVYHSAHGHTEFIARQVQDFAQSLNCVMVPA